MVLFFIHLLVVFRPLALVPCFLFLLCTFFPSFFPPWYWVFATHPCRRGRGAWTDGSGIKRSLFYVCLCACVYVVCPGICPVHLFTLPLCSLRFSCSYSRSFFIPMAGFQWAYWCGDDDDDDGVVSVSLSVSCCSTSSLFPFFQAPSVRSSIIINTISIVIIGLMAFTGAGDPWFFFLLIFFFFKVLQGLCLWRTGSFSSFLFPLS